MTTDYKVTDTELTSVANAIRTKGGTSSPLEWPTGYVNAVGAIPSSGSNILSGDSPPAAGQGSNGDIYLEYLDSDKLYSETNTTYIDLGFGGGTYNIEVMFSFDAAHAAYNTGNAWAFGNYSSSKQTMIGINSGGVYVSANGTIATCAFDNAPHKILFEQNSVSFDGSVVIGVGIANALALNYYAFATNANSPAGAIPHTSIYEISCFNPVSGNLEKHFIPSVENGVNGFLETVSNTFYAPGSNVLNIGQTQGEIVGSYAKVSGAWQDLIGSNISDLNLGS